MRLRELPIHFGLFLSLGGAVAQGQVSQRDVKASSSGSYSDGVAPVFVEATSEPPPVEGRTASTQVSIAEGGANGSARAYAFGSRLQVNAVAEPLPHAGLGSDVTSAASARFFDGITFFAIAHNVWGARMVVRVKGRVSFAQTPFGGGTVILEVKGLAAINSPTTDASPVLTQIWHHFPPQHPVPTQNFNQSGTLPIADDPPNFLQIQLSPTIYSIELQMAVDVVASTGHDPEGNPLGSRAVVQFGAEREPPPAVASPAQEAMESPAEESEYLPPLPPYGDRGASIAGIQFLDANGNVLDLEPGDVVFSTVSGAVYPVLGPSLPWLSGGDDYDDNAKDTEQWDDAEGSGVLEEVDFALEYRAAAGDHEAVWPLRIGQAPLTENCGVRCGSVLEFRI